MTGTTYHVRKVSLGFKRKYRIAADDGTGRPGEPLAYGDKALTVADELMIYRDEQRIEKLVSLRESSKGWLAALTGFEAFDGDERLLGSFGVLVRRSLQRTTWQCDQPGLGRFIGTERSVGAARVRRLLGFGGAGGQIAGALVKYHFDFERDGIQAFTLEKPKVFDDWYKLTVQDDDADRLLLFALAITMEARRS
ncbi:hypothetical protein CLV35_1171 [Motilibacter peucedani]|uniref:Scramblase n=1 Tax=Motilibacter peucedani TaxID=598650 RepID=A0A420XRH3_9ACTN|nr:hypothetical protein [Motilibacter peucedani]RKS77485.1 hypothetical protein CLV35_1171 [Motilibacter peucedani]